MLFQHGRAGAGGRNHVVETLEGSDGLLRQRAGVGAVARVVGRLAAAGLRLGHLDTAAGIFRSEEHTSELQSLMRTSYAVFCLKKKTNKLAMIHTKSHLHPHPTSLDAPDQI